MKRPALIILLLATFSVFLIACGGAEPESPSDSGDSEGPELPTPLPQVEPTANTGAGEQSEIPGASVFETSNEISANEQLAQAVGETVYSGYTCVISPEGCACEQPIIERISFNFLDDGTLLYAFSGDGYSSQWNMERVAEDHWSYTIPIYNDLGSFIGAFTVLMIINDEGFSYTSGADYVEEGFVTCPDVEYRRVN